VDCRSAIEGGEGRKKLTLFKGREAAVAIQTIRLGGEYVHPAQTRTILNFKVKEREDIGGIPGKIERSTKGKTGSVRGL